VKAIICLSGDIASGKTTVAQALAERFPSVAVRSFGEVVRQQARRQGKSLGRATLQAVGLSLVQAGWPAFVDALLEDVPQSFDVLIVDGIRHVEAVDELRRRHVSGRFLTVYLTVAPATQEQRLRERGESLSSRGHIVESSLPEVEASADVVIDSMLPLAEIEDRILHML
jgi:dephospho-CoA kinase